MGNEKPREPSARTHPAIMLKEVPEGLAREGDGIGMGVNTHPLARQA
jgi:hypothetical protein